jgi:cell division protein FtsI (penicillin-binding protein 3)
VRLIFWLASFFWLALIGRLAQIQILQAERFQAQAQAQNFRHASQKAGRGTIYDRNGLKLAKDITTQSFFAVPDSITNPAEVALRFSNFFGKEYRTLFENLKSDRKFVWVERQVDLPQAEEVRNWKLKGVSAREELKREHPLGELAQELIGLTDIDNKGISGLELHYDSILAGQDGSEVLQKDALGQVYELEEREWKEARPGSSLALTVDAKLQWILENRLRQGIIQTKSSSGFGILMDPQTGEILALASLSRPGFPEGENQGRLRPLTDQFEPGSTMKAFTAAAAIEEKIKSPDELIYAEKGKWATGIGKRVLHDIHEYEMLSFEEAIAYSSNIALAKTGLAVGSEKLYKYFRNFGFGFKTGIELPGEASGTLQPFGDWNKITLISNSIGYGISTTALQLTSAYAAIANGGWLMKPYLVKAILDSQGNLLREYKPTPIRQVISPQTAQTIRGFLKQVVEIGTGIKAKLEGVEIGGKTGTARKVKAGSKGYLDQYISSFVGFFPVEQPRYLGFLALDGPKGMVYGGQTAAQVFKEIVKDILSLPTTPTNELIKKAEPAHNGEGTVATIAAKNAKVKENSKKGQTL